MPMDRRHLFRAVAALGIGTPAFHRAVAAEVLREEPKKEAEPIKHESAEGYKQKPGGRDPAAPRNQTCHAGPLFARNSRPAGCSNPAGRLLAFYSAAMASAGLPGSPYSAADLRTAII